MVDIKEIVKETIEEKVEDVIEELEEVEGNIFDEDLESVENEVSDFDIGSTMLSSAPPVESWQGQNLEEAISRERIEKDWSGDEEFVGGDFYKSSESSDVYGSGGSGVYGTGGSDVYGASGSGAYDSGKSDGNYSAESGNRGNIKSYDQIKDERRASRSMLEIVGLDGSSVNKKKTSRDDVGYSNRDIE